MRLRRNTLVEREKQREDSGFGTNATSTTARLIDQSGNFNVKKIGQSLEARVNLYHKLITMSWPKFAFVALGFYLTVNLSFGIVYYYIGIENLMGVDKSHGLSDFWEAFFFSSQTMTTVGYGRVSPVGYITNIIASVEAFLGLLSFSILTGLLYGRFSRPVPRILYSEKAIIAPYLDINGLMVRMANEKSNQLINVEASMIFSRNEIENGMVKRKYYGLDLERSKVKFFAMSWTLVHPITEKSVLFGETPESLKASDAEILVSVEGTNDTFADYIHSRKSYLFDEIEMGRKFKPMLLESTGDTYLLDLTKLSDTSEIELNALKSED
ncbi:MAG: potassium transporter [Cytophagaceae bacterium]|nr:potassium transporter [Cytophagaceae bacterium]MBL0303551.1 potassium transporter [Cytophagaceae bacterium]MBL0326379.1 potassium transporter [Cytophagaceae bacterium]